VVKRKVPLQMSPKMKLTLASFLALFPFVEAQAGPICLRLTGSQYHFSDADTVETHPVDVFVQGCGSPDAYGVDMTAATQCYHRTNSTGAIVARQCGASPIIHDRARNSSFPFDGSFSLNLVIGWMVPGSASLSFVSDSHQGCFLPYNTYWSPGTYPRDAHRDTLVFHPGWCPEVKCDDGRYKWRNGNCYPCEEGMILDPGTTAPNGCHPVCDPNDTSCLTCVQNGGGVACKCNQKTTHAEKQACFCANGIGGNACNNPSPGDGSGGGGDSGGGNPGGGGDSGGGNSGGDSGSGGGNPGGGDDNPPPSEGSTPPPSGGGNDDDNEDDQECRAPFSYRWSNGTCGECPESNPNCKACTDPKLPHRWNSDGECHDCPENNKECKGCTDPKLPYKWEDGKCHECPEGIEYCKCEAEKSVAGQSTIPVRFVCEDGASSIIFNSATTEKKVKRGKNTAVIQSRAAFKWVPKEYNGKTEGTAGWTFDKYQKYINPSSDVPTMLDYHALDGNTLYRLRVYPTDRERFGSCGDSLLGNAVNLRLRQVPVAVEKYTCSDSQIADTTDLSKLTCELKKKVSFENAGESNAQVGLSFKLGSSIPTTIAGLPAEAHAITSTRISLSLGKTSGAISKVIPADLLIHMISGRGVSQPEADPSRDNFIRETKELSRVLAVQKDVVEAFSNSANYPNGKPKKSSVNGLTALRDFMRVATDGPETGTWASSGTYIPKLTANEERKLMKSLDYLGDRCQSISNGDIVRAALKVTGGDLPLSIVLLRNISLNVAGIMREFWDAKKGYYERRLEGSAPDYYAPEIVENFVRKLRFLEDHRIQVLDDPLGPWYHFFGALMAAELRVGFLTWVEIMVYDKTIFASRNPNIVQNESGKAGWYSRSQIKALSRF